MFWILKKSRITNSAVSFFNSLNNNSNKNSGNGLSNTGTGGGYNKLCCSDEPTATELRLAGEATGGLKRRPVPPPAAAAAAGLGLRSPPSQTDNFGGNLTDIDTESSCSELDLDDDLSQDSDYGESLTCNVCDRYFCSAGQLSAHQQKKRHFGCSSCDSLFPSHQALEHHKDEFEHWTGGEGCLSISEASEEDDTSYEMERLL